MVFELVDNSIDEAQAGFATTVEVWRRQATIFTSSIVVGFAPTMTTATSSAPAIPRVTVLKSAPGSIWQRVNSASSLARVSGSRSSTARTARTATAEAPTRATSTPMTARVSAGKAAAPAADFSAPGGALPFPHAASIAAPTISDRRDLMSTKTAIYRRPFRPCQRRKHTSPELRGADG